MYQEGQLVMFETTGVCRIDMIGPPPSDFPEEFRQKLYYHLTELYGHNNRLYAPVDGKSYMRPILSRSEAEALIAGIPTSAPDPSELPASQRACTEGYKALLSTHSCADLIQLLRIVHHKNKQAELRGKKPWLINQQYRQRAEKLLFGELASALGIGYDDVEPYIENCMSTK